jgi:hypothetical protein
VTARHLTGTLPPAAGIRQPEDIVDRNAGYTQVVQTAYGRVRGIRYRGVNLFRGIPYGGSTEGTRRFLPSQPPSRGQAWWTQR